MAEEPEEIEEIIESAASLMDRVPEGAGLEEMVSIELPEETDMIARFFVPRVISESIGWVFPTPSFFPFCGHVFDFVLRMNCDLPSFK